MLYTQVVGNLITKAKRGLYDVIIHGCNCWGGVGGGIAYDLSLVFNTKKDITRNTFDFNKLGTIQIIPQHKINEERKKKDRKRDLTVVNCYTQLHPGPHLNYVALELCLMKVNHAFAGKKLGMPRIGCGIGGGDWKVVDKIIQRTLIDLSEVQVVTLPKSSIFKYDRYIPTIESGVFDESHSLT